MFNLSGCFGGRLFQKEFMINILILKNTAIDSSPLMAGEIESVSEADAATLVAMGKAEYTKKTRKKSKDKWQSNQTRI
jgi:hypothetical protein